MPDPTTQTPWYAAGLRFGCTQSGLCCQNHGDHAYVYLTESEVQALADHLGLPLDEFSAEYTREEDGWTLIAIDGPRCRFLDEDNRCTVYEVRPVQCRTWPFWVENLKSPAAWRTVVQGVCAGAGCGRLYTAEEIERLAQGTEDWYDGVTDTPPI